MAIARKLRLAREVAGDWRYWIFYAQRRFMNPATRQRIADWVARSRSRPARLWPRLEPQAKRDAEALKTEGVVDLGTVLSAEACARLRDYFLTKKVVDGYRPEIPPFLPFSEERHPHSHVAYHEAEDVLLAPGLLELANDPRILSIVEEFLGARPTISYFVAWWSYPTELGAQQAENFHRDVDDLAFIKLFIYLTDVDEESGPHVYVRNSPGDKRLTVLRRYEDREVLAAYGNNQVIRWTGPAGAGFLENTFGLHKGQPVARGRRLIFQAVYSLLPIPYGPKSPLMRRGDHPAAAATDAWVNRIYLAR